MPICEILLWIIEINTIHHQTTGQPQAVVCKPPPVVCGQLRTVIIGGSDATWNVLDLAQFVSKPPPVRSGCLQTTGGWVPRGGPNYRMHGDSVPRLHIYVIAVVVRGTTCLDHVGDGFMWRKETRIFIWEWEEQE